jgi:hypothetical protein
MADCRLREQRPDRAGVAHVLLLEAVARIVERVLQRAQVPRIRQLVDRQHGRVRPPDQPANQRRSDETRAPGDEDALRLDGPLVQEDLRIDTARHPDRS